MRINKFIASNSQFSRRKADELIKKGKVFLNGKKIKTLGIIIDPEKDEIKISNTIITPKQKKIYLALNKPKGYITSRSDNLNRKTVMDLVPKIENLKPVGRLDKDTEGLLLLSNDGEFINHFTHPSFNCEKEYLVEIEGYLEENEKNKLEKGVLIDNKKTSPSRIQILKKSNFATRLKIIIYEGRNRQIRKMFAYFKHNVKYLKRIRIGLTSLGTLKKGKYKNLIKREIYAD